VKPDNHCGLRGCSGRTKRRGRERFCAQLAIVYRDGQGYCYYHDPLRPRKFGEGYPPIVAKAAKAAKEKN
jgi:hypothetical protein